LSVVGDDVVVHHFVEHCDLSLHDGDHLVNSDLVQLLKLVLELVVHGLNALDGHVQASAVLSCLDRQS